MLAPKPPSAPKPNVAYQRPLTVLSIGRYDLFPDMLYIKKATSQYPYDFTPYSYFYKVLIVLMKITQVKVSRDATFTSLHDKLAEILKTLLQYAASVIDNEIKFPQNGKNSTNADHMTAYHANQKLLELTLSNTYTNTSFPASFKLLNSELKRFDKLYYKQNTSAYTCRVNNWIHDIKMPLVHRLYNDITELEERSEQHPLCDHLTSIYGDHISATEFFQAFQILYQIYRQTNQLPMTQCTTGGMVKANRQRAHVDGRERCVYIDAKSKRYIKKKQACGKYAYVPIN